MDHHGGLNLQLRTTLARVQNELIVRALLRPGERHPDCAAQDA
jgi:hypothetical protein